MDNKQDRQFYWEVKDFMNKKAEFSSAKSQTPKITDTVKNVLEQNNPYVQKSFSEKSNYIPAVQNTIKTIAESEKGYQQKCKAFTKNKDVNGFQQMKSIMEGIVNVPGRGNILVPDEEELSRGPIRTDVDWLQRQQADAAAEATQRAGLQRSAEMAELRRINPNDRRVLAYQEELRQRGQNVGGTPTPAPQRTQTPAPQRTATPAPQRTRTTAPQRTAAPAPQAEPPVVAPPSSGARELASKPSKMANLGWNAAEMVGTGALSVGADLILNPIARDIVQSAGFSGEGAMLATDMATGALTSAAAEVPIGAAINKMRGRPLTQGLATKAGVAGVIGGLFPLASHAIGKGMEKAFDAEDDISDRD